MKVPKYGTLDKNFKNNYSWTMIETGIVEKVVSQMNNYFLGNDDYFSGTRDVFTARMRNGVQFSEKPFSVIGCLAIIDFNKDT